MCEKLNMFLYKNAIFRSSQIESNNVDSFWYQVVVATLQLSPPSLSPPSLWSPLSPPSLQSPLSPPQDHHYGTIKLRSNEARINAFQPNPCHHSWRWNYFINNSLVFVKDTRPARREWAIHSHLSTSSKKLKCCRCLLKNCLPPPTAMICWPLLGRFNHAYHYVIMRKLKYMFLKQFPLSSQFDATWRPKRSRRSVEKRYNQTSRCWSRLMFRSY